MCASARPIAFHHHLFIGRHSFSPCPLFHTSKCNFSCIRQYGFKNHNSLQIHNPNNSSTPAFTLNATIVPASDSTPTNNRGASDPELRAVLDIATDSELFDLQNILFGPSYFSPLLKSITNGAKFNHFMSEDFELREQFIDVLESRFLFLAADARSTLRGWRPSYRNVLLNVREELSIPCSRKLATEDLELEIFIHVIHQCSRHWDTGAALRVGTAELCSALIKGGQLISLLKISELVSARLSRKAVLEVAKHKIKGKVLKKGFTGVASKALGFHSLASFVGPILWGTFLADAVIQMLGTDYIRILQAIYAFAQIRILRKHGLYLDKLNTTGF